MKAARLVIVGILANPVLHTSDNCPGAEVKLALLLEPKTDARVLRAMATSSDGKRIAAADESGRIHLWHLPNGEPLGTLKSQKAAWVSGLAFTPDGKQLLEVAYGGKIRIWSLDELSLQDDTFGDVLPYGSLAVSPANGILATIHGRRTVTLWDFSQRVSKWKWSPPPDVFVRSCDFLANGASLAVSTGREIVVLDCATGIEQETHLGPGSAVITAVVAKRGTLAWVDGSGAMVTGLDGRSRRRIPTRDHVDFSSPTLDQTGSYLAIGMPDPRLPRVVVFDVRTGRELCSFQPSRMIGSISIINGGEHQLRVAVCGSGKGIEIWTISLDQ